MESATGVEPGSEVSPYYDPMIAKIVAHADRRGNAAALLRQKLEGLAVWPVRTNAAFLYNVLGHPAFRGADITTGFIAEYLDELVGEDVPSALLLRQAAQVIVDRYEEADVVKLPGFRLNAPPRCYILLEVDGRGYAVEADREPFDNVHASSLDRDGALVTLKGQTFGVFLKRGKGADGGTAGDGAILSPMPGRIVSVEVTTGQTVTKGQKLLTLEAMKMEHTLAAPFDGTVAELNAAPGAQVQVEALLARIEREAE